jgi:uncharacterized membrane protein
MQLGGPGYSTVYSSITGGEMGSTRSFVRGLTLGAGAMYLLDPEQGKLRREQLARKAGHLFDNAGFQFGETRHVQVGHYGARGGDIAGLDAASLGRQRSMHPAGAGNNSAMKLLGGVLALYGLSRRGMFGSLFRTVGTGLLVGSAGRGVSVSAYGDRRRAVDIQKTMYIDAPLEQVFAFWSNYENFPLFMSHVREVQDLGGGRSRWSVSGPGGVPIEWHAVLTEQVPNGVIAWQSEPGSMLENAGVIRFARNSESGTRVDLRFCYHPPAGGAGQAVVELLGSDPRAKLNEDLGRMKSLLEATHRSETHGKESQS